MIKISFRPFVCVFFLMVLGVAASAELSFFMIDNFESGRFDKWYKFGEMTAGIVENGTPEGRDTINESCGDYSLGLKGSSLNYYVGGIGSDLNVDATLFSRIQMDIYGAGGEGKIKVELFDDDNNNYALEQDSDKDWIPTNDDKWVAEVPVLGRGFTRVSIPFTAFRLENPGAGDGEWNPNQRESSGGLLKIQMIVLTNQPKGEIETRVDNILLTY
ncbi:hypothetical protein A3K48_02670 [candidate division WOR-1 bacterium RIFOXYA12_FULL_52_29]|uniref:NADH:ubiquinone oxidoreductase intermediate-associated protein 30 domain-containing protein n=1 Tax=candidate division WOR-1 bacterium RIFOXYC12_FULL_54_18 TaxID=1802584 RepID=A0A1F4T719_UNCSA|nr:MAG: hypothetical protein A3K44_02670 [candidate division WOR-1 bacterium RIFOXYA2_FULL_51_19]OGC17476.1 MAG: hypothetical protein A3K48_02670 [candidate division WOR-1 bacterium RIFOXYA12_FULL_52_29]OGC26334.1 MAG: hypothetical protein A3K32_02665 [candidate division WOR-1 bacterium RIFOXYB2_FULL_45_9]OGC27893.1 MAG: hypothetical protein A3K49_02670 [candidate division WOR-1 bacterium RIFOXYC12_FULL_54_18]OGC29819.1 MAG: hypothetical protein A2346_03665 [candidate division WOR-1 bacterium R